VKRTASILPIATGLLLLQTSAFAALSIPVSEDFSSDPSSEWSQTGTTFNIGWNSGTDSVDFAWNEVNGDGAVSYTFEEGSSFPTVPGDFVRVLDSTLSLTAASDLENSYFGHTMLGLDIQIRSNGRLQINHSGGSYTDNSLGNFVNAGDTIDLLTQVSVTNFNGTTGDVALTLIISNGTDDFTDNSIAFSGIDLSDSDVGFILRAKSSSATPTALAGSFNSVSYVGTPIPEANTVYGVVMIAMMAMVRRRARR